MNHIETSFSTYQGFFSSVEASNQDIWIGDSGASSHLTNDSKWIFNKESIKSSVVVANRDQMNIKFKGLLNVTFIHKDGSEVNKTLEVKYCPQLTQTLFSFTSALANDWTMLGSLKSGRINIQLSKKGEKCVFFD